MDPEVIATDSAWMVVSDLVTSSQQIFFAVEFYFLIEMGLSNMKVFINYYNCPYFYL